MSKTDEIRNEIIEMIRLGIIGPGEKIRQFGKQPRNMMLASLPLAMPITPLFLSSWWSPGLSRVIL